MKAARARLHLRRAVVRDFIAKVPLQRIAARYHLCPTKTIMRWLREAGVVAVLALAACGPVTPPVVEPTPGPTPEPTPEPTTVTTCFAWDYEELYMPRIKGFRLYLAGTKAELVATPRPAPAREVEAPLKEVCVADMAPNTAHAAAVTAFGEAGESVFSNVLEFTTSALPGSVSHVVVQ